MLKKVKKIDTDYTTTRILIVDDDKFIAKILRSMLDMFEVASVQLTPSVDAAIKILSHHTFDCIFVDNMLTDKNGLELAKYIRRSESESTRETAIILYTAYTGVQSVIEARDSGVTEVLAKPVSPEQVMEKLNNALYNKREFIVSDVYLGPDRRRRIRDVDAVEDRRIVNLPPEKADEEMNEQDTEPHAS